MSANHVQIVLIKPEGYVHSEGLREVLETLQSALLALGLPVVLDENQFDVDAVNLVVGWHLLHPSQYSSLPKQCILYNLEQFSERNQPLCEALVAQGERFEIWDYSVRNIQILRNAGFKGALKHVPIGYAPEMTRIPKAPEQDIDVLFYGSLNARREAMLAELRRLGLKVVHVFGVYGQDRDALIARAKVVLTLHFYETNIFEIVRVSYLLANRKAVVAEGGGDTELDDELRAVVRAVPYAQLAQACLDLVRDATARVALEEAGFAWMVRHPQVDYLARVLSEEPDASGPAAPAGTGPALPRRINLGSGKDWREDMLNLDFNGLWHPDVVLDICAPLDSAQVHRTDRFGPVRLESGAFDEIIANDVLEHLPDLMTAMGNALTLLAEGGRFLIKVPYDLGYGAWQDPTHVRAFNERSWLYYTDWFWYLGWTTHRFDLEELTMVPSPLGKQLLDRGMDSEELCRQPRAIDDMAVVLRKRPLTAEERRLGEAHRAGSTQARPAAGAGPGTAAAGPTPWQDLPVFIINRDRLSPLRRLVDWLRGVGMRRIFILDNASSYPPLLDYYHGLGQGGPVQVVALGQNYGPYALWKLGLLREVNTPYLVTDSDLIPAEGCPADLIERMLEVLKQHPDCGKVGAGLRIDNLPEGYGQRDLVVKWESQFWHRPVAEGLYAAAVDTTFALYPAHAAFTNAPHNLRLGFPYVFEHTPWYVDERHLEPEEAFYRAHASTEFANWSMGDKTAWLEQTEQVKDYAFRKQVLHLGGGDQPIPGWINADLAGRALDATLEPGWSGSALPFPDQTFDGLYLPRPLAAVTDPQGFLAELLRVAKPGARGFFRIPGGQGLAPALPAAALAGLLEHLTGAAATGADRHWQPLRLQLLLDGPEPAASEPLLPFLLGQWSRIREAAFTLQAAPGPGRPVSTFPGALQVSRDALLFPEF